MHASIPDHLKIISSPVFSPRVAKISFWNGKTEHFQWVENAVLQLGSLVALVLPHQRHKWRTDSCISEVKPEIIPLELFLLNSSVLEVSLKSAHKFSLESFTKLEGNLKEMVTHLASFIHFVLILPLKVFQNTFFFPSAFTVEIQLTSHIWVAL